MTSDSSSTLQDWGLSTIFISHDEKRHPHQDATWHRTKLLDTGTTTGVFGEVWQELCTSGPRAKQVRVVKQIRKDSGVTSLTTRQLEILVALSTAANEPRYLKHFVHFFEWFGNSDDFYIATEYVPYGDLQGYVGRQPFSEHETAAITSQVALALDCMHRMGAVHRDLKPTVSTLSSRTTSFCLSMISPWKLTPSRISWLPTHGQHGT